MSRKVKIIDEQEAKKEQLSPNSQMLFDLLTECGVIADKNINDATKRDIQRKKRLASYHNTLLLLKNYRTLAWLMECFPDTIAEELEVPFVGVDKIADKLDVELSLDNRKIENRMSTLLQSRLLLDRVNEALTVLKRKPGDGEEMYKIIYQTYIAKDKPKYSDILYRLNISGRRYYRLREQAITIISIRLWGTSKPETDVLIQVLDLFDKQKGYWA